MLTATFVASLLTISAAEGNAKTVKTIDGVPVSPSYASFHEQLSRDKSVAPKEISEALEYFVGEWKGTRLSSHSQPHLTWSVRRAGANHLIVSTTETVEWEDRVEARKGRILIGWDSKEKRVKLFSFEYRCPSLTEEYISWQVSSPNKWVSRTFEGHMLQPPLREILLEKSEPDEFVIRQHFDMMHPVGGTKFVRVESAEDAEADSPARGVEPSKPDEDNSGTTDPTSADVDLDDPQQLVQAIGRRSAYWIAPASPKLKTLNYTYLLGHEQRPVTLVKREPGVCYRPWQGCTLRTGFHALMGEPERFAIEVEGSGDQTLGVVASLKDAGPPVRIEVGNGIESSWHGYFSHSSRDVVLVVEKKRLIPLEERVGGTTTRYRDWKEVEPGRWVPCRIDISHGEMRYRMHYDWMGGAVWLLTRGESVSRYGIATVRARIRNVVVNSKAVKCESGAIAPAVEKARIVKKIHGVPVHVSYAEFFERLAGDKSEVPKEISETLDYFVGEWKGQWFLKDRPPHISWSVRRAGRNCLVVSETVTSTSKEQPGVRTGKILIGWDAKEKRFKYYSTGAHLGEAYISWEVKAPNKWASRSFDGPGVGIMPPDEIVLEKTGRDDFFIQHNRIQMMSPAFIFVYVRVEPAKEAENGGPKD